jgi:zinc/manganese transport system permease protein
LIVAVWPEGAQVLGPDFMREAFLAGTGVATAAGLVGYFVVLRNQVFTGDALGHVAFTGGLGGVLLGLPLLAAVFGGTIGSALLMGALGGRGRGRDVAIGTVFAWVLGLGVLFLSLYAGSHSDALGVGILFGSLLTLGRTQATLAAVAGGATSLALLAICRPLLFASIDPEVAAARALPVRTLDLVFLGLVGATVAGAVQAVGALLIFGLLVTPPAIAQNLTPRPYLGLALSGAIAVALVWVGLALSFYLAYPVSVFVVGPAFITYLASVAWARSRAPAPTTTGPVLP